MSKGVKRIIGARGDDQLMLRMPDGLRDRIRSIAAMNGRSMNTEIIILLDATYPAPAVPESINEALLSASEDVVRQWTDLLRVLGQDPHDNAALEALKHRIIAAKSEGSK